MWSVVSAVWSAVSRVPWAVSRSRWPLFASNAMATSTSEARALFRALLRTGAHFPSYNVREYILRRTKEDFRAAVSETDPAKLGQLWARAKGQLEVFQRQSVVYGLYGRKIKNVLELDMKLAEEHTAL